jgi:hypothetical protein
MFAFCFVLFLLSCNEQNNQKLPQAKDSAKNEPVKKESTSSIQNNTNFVDNSPAQKVYELKEDGLYIYSDAAPKIDTSKLGFKTIIQKNFKYLRVPSSNELLGNKEEINNQICDTTGKNNFGKPSLEELGYDRHKEREIMPEDNRFGINKFKDTTIQHKKKGTVTKFKTLTASAFMKMSRNEFKENGIVIIGKHISRVVIKSLDNLPTWGDTVVVEKTETTFDCYGEETGTIVTLPIVIADFQRINFKENIFEFVKEDPIPNNSAYLSDEELMKLTNDIHQLIPRVNARPIRNVAVYIPGYYIIEYYNGDQLYTYHCIKLTNGPSPYPALWDKLEINAPTSSANVQISNDKCYLVISEFNTTEEARNFVKRKPVGDALIYHLQNGKSVLAVECESKKLAESEMKRYLNMGFSKESLKIEKF